MKSIRELRHIMQQLGQDLDALAHHLTAAAGQIQEQRVIPSKELDASLSRSRARMTALWKALRVTAEGGSLEVTIPDDTSSLADVERILDRMEAEEKKRNRLTEFKNQAYETLSILLRLRHRDNLDFPALADCQEAARAFLQELQSSPIQNGGSIPGDWEKRLGDFTAVVRLAKDGQGLSEEECEALSRRVADAFSNKLVMAALLGRITSFPKEIHAGVDPISPGLSEIGTDAVSPSGISTSSVSHPEDSEPQSPALLKPDSTADFILEPPTTGQASIQPNETDTTEEHDQSMVQGITGDSTSRPEATKSVKEKEEITAISVSTGLDSAISAGEIQPPVVPREAEQPYHEPDFDLPPGGWPLHMTGAEMASRFLETGIDDPRDIQEQIWQLLLESRLDFAYHLGRFLDDQHLDYHPRIPSWLLRNLILGNYVLYHNSDIAAQLREGFFQFNPDICFSDIDPVWNQAVRLLLTAASVRPAIVAPSTGAAVILRDIHFKDGLNELYKFINALASFPDQGIPISPEYLESVRTGSAWEDSIRTLQEEAQIWYQHAKNATIKYQAATRVWEHWTKPGNMIHQAIDMILRNDPNDVPEAKNWMDQYSTSQAIDQAVKRTDRKIIKRNSGQDIHAGALENIRSKVKEIRDLLSQWLRSQEQRPGPAHDYRVRQAQRFQDLIRQSRVPILQELRLFQERYQVASRSLRAAGQVCRSAFENLFSLFDPTHRSEGKEPPVRNLLNYPLLLIPGRNDPDTWERTERYDKECLREFLVRVAQEDFALETAFARHCESRDHEATGHLLQYLNGQQKEVSEWERKREEHLTECRKALARDVESTTLDVENAVALGFVPEADRLKLLGEIQSIEQNLNDILSFSPHHQQLEEIRKEIREKRNHHIDLVRTRLNEKLDRNAPAFSRIEQVIQTGDVYTANEYIQMILDGHELPEPDDSRDIFEEFFFDKRPPIEAYLESEHDKNRPTWSQIAAGLKNHASNLRNTFRLGPIDLTHIRGPQARSAAEMIENWFTLKRLRADRFEPRYLNAFLEALGFHEVTSSILLRGSKSHWVNVRTRPIEDRALCPVPQYGSLARGVYRFLLLWDRPIEDAIYSEVGETAGAAPVIVAHFGRLTEKRRRDLISPTRGQPRSFLVLDDTLVLFLCGEKQMRLPSFFACTLPFTFLNPYSTTAGLVPPEVFFGRSHERNKIMDPLGSCFIYGGRQLGKTALLRDVERRFHNPREGRIAIYIDLKTKGLGLDRHINDIWKLIEEEFRRHRIIPPQARPIADPSHLGRAVQEWLAKDSQRRILLMLDEADRFLTSDSHAEKNQEGFVRTSRLKGWMDDTGRRFKVVFAGLHNVQRTTRLSNHPLAQYGAPICIGPLLNNGDMREAQALAETPLRMCGYRMETKDLTMRILSQTNFYPSLIQLYCSQLLQHVSDPHTRKFDPAQSPPFRLNSHHVEGAYRSQDLRKAIRDRFIWTLQLDPRYEVIAYAIAYNCLENPEQGISQGYTISWIEKQVQDWWPQGFESRHSDIPLDALLAEMTGLGILREVPSEDGLRHYALRSPNVTQLLGTREEIETELLRPRQLEPPYVAAAFRSAYRGQNASVNPAKRNPLTAQQEEEFRQARNGVFLIAGSLVTGLEDLSSFLECGFSPYFSDVKRGSQFPDFQKKLSDLPNKDHEGNTLLFAGPECSWTEEWIQAAIEKVNRLKSHRKFIQVVFTADPARLWDLLAGSSILEHVNLISLSPWHESMLRRWLDDCGYQTTPEDCRLIAQVTGSWPGLLLEFHKHTHMNAHTWKQNLLELEKELQQPATAARWVSHFSIPPEPWRVLKIMADLNESATIEDLTALLDEESSEAHVERVMEWGQILSYVARTPGGGQYRLDSLLQTLLNASDHLG